MLVLYDMGLFCVGLVVLSWSSDWLVKKASVIARYFRISPFVVGVVLLGMGTSAPEWAVSSLASLQGLSDLALGNVMGSNLFNTLIVLSVIVFSVSSVRGLRWPLGDSVFLFLGTLVLVPLFYGFWLSRGEALVLLALFVIYMIFSIKNSSMQQGTLSFSGKMSFPGKPSFPQALLSFPRKRESTSHNQQDEASLAPGGSPGGGDTKPGLSFTKELVFIVLSFVLLAGGSHLTIQGAVGFGQFVGLSERVTGVLLVSVGTSLPELVVSIAAIRKSEKSMALGNVMGSNIFNTFAILGTAGLIHPLRVKAQVLTLDLPVLLLAYGVLLVVFGGPVLFSRRPGRGLAAESASSTPPPPGGLSGAVTDKSGAAGEGELSDSRSLDSSLRRGCLQGLSGCFKRLGGVKLWLPCLFLAGYGVYISCLLMH